MLMQKHILQLGIALLPLTEYSMVRGNKLKQ